jgi:dienelactone hydrolase
MHRGLPVLLGSAVVAAAAQNSAPPAADAAVMALLGQEVIGSALPLWEVQHYCEARVVRMPQVRTAAAWEEEAQRLRQAVLTQVVFRGEAAAWRDASAGVEWLDTIPGGPGYHIRKLRYEALPGLWIPSLLYEPEVIEGKVPVVLNVNGHVGAPGKAVPYKQIRCINLAKRGLLALNVEWPGMGQLASEGFYHYRMNQLDLCGTSALAVHYLYLKRGLDVLLGHSHADPGRVAVTGLSGGGWQTIFISALDPRVTLANPVAGYSSFRTRAIYTSDLGDSEQTPTDLGALADYTHLTALRAPRPTLITMNAKDDCCFAAGHALQPLLRAAWPVFRLCGQESALDSHVNTDPGTHNYELDNRQAFYRFVKRHFFADSPGFDASEIPADSEVKPKEVLDVPLPAGMPDFHTLALELSRNLPRDPALPTAVSAAEEWQQRGRDRLREIVRLRDFGVSAVQVASSVQGETQARSWRLRLGEDWTVPAVELFRGSPRQTTLLVADGGRVSAAAEAERLLAAGERVIALDPFYFGESKISERDFLFALLVATVGDRPLGVQASQVAAVARWALAKERSGPLRLLAVGPRSSTFALVAAALETGAIGAVEVHQPLTSLRQVIEQNATVEQMPELFCFGLLEAFDIRQIAALIAPRPVVFRGSGERARTDLAGLADWYRLLGQPLDPVE